MTTHRAVIVLSQQRGRRVLAGGFLSLLAPVQGPGDGQAERHAHKHHGRARPGLLKGLELPVAAGRFNLIDCAAPGAACQRWLDTSAEQQLGRCGVDVGLEREGGGGGGCRLNTEAGAGLQSYALIFARSDVAVPKRTSAPMLVASAVPVTPMVLLSIASIAESPPPPPGCAPNSCATAPRGAADHNSTQTRVYLLL